MYVHVQKESDFGNIPDHVLLDESPGTCAYTVKSQRHCSKPHWSHNLILLQTYVRLIIITNPKIFTHIFICFTYKNTNFSLHQSSNNILTIMSHIYFAYSPRAPKNCKQSFSNVLNVRYNYQRLYNVQNIFFLSNPL